MGWSEAPMRSACWRVALVGGVPRRLFWGVVLLTVLATGMSWFGGVWYLSIPLIGSAGAALEFGRRAVRQDPMAMQVWWRWVRSPARSGAVGGHRSRPRVLRTPERSVS